MSARRLFAVLVLSLVAATPALAAKRRAARSAPAAVAPPTGSCHTFGLVRAGLKATYRATGQGGDADFTITWITDTPTFTHTTQKIVTPQATTDAETRLDGEIVGNLRALKHFNVKTSTIVPFLGAVTTDTDVDFVPSLVQGPAAGWCVGNTWTVSPVTETIVTRSSAGTQQQVVTTIASTGEVLAVGAALTLPGVGTFQTVKYRGATVAGTSVQTAVTWVSMEHNIVVRQDTLDAAGNVTGTQRLTAVQ
jgi:hypothetical protein